MNCQVAQKQKGISMSGLLMWSVILVLAAIIGMRIAPAYIEHSTIKKNLAAIEKEIASQTTDINQIRLSFSKRAQIDNITAVNAQDILISRGENGVVVLSAKYVVKIPLVSNISLNIDFEATGGNK